MNNKGFTLIELLAVVAILSIVMSIGAYSITTYMNTAKTKSNNLLKSNIKKAAQIYVDECVSDISTLSCTKDPSSTNKNYIVKVTLGELANYNILSSNNNNVFNTKNEIINNCEIQINRKVDEETYYVEYKIIASNKIGDKCPVQVIGDEY